MAFDPDPFNQARVEVNNKSMGAQIAHSGIFHSMRSAFSSPSKSGVSKGLGLALGVGKLFLAAIPIPVVGAIVGATVDAINGKVRSDRHQKQIDAATTHEEKAKFNIKELTVENLDRFRWKLAHAFEELKDGIAAYNTSGQTCDDMYKFALLYEQLERRKLRLRNELNTFQEVINNVEAWIREVETIQGPLLTKARNEITKKTGDEITLMNRLVPSNPADQASIEAFKSAHINCSEWCYFKKEAKYNASADWGTFKENAGKVSKFLLPIAVASVAVRQSDYTNNADNSKFRE
jgi:hypothetical protein